MLALCLISGLILHYVAAVSVKAIKNLNECHDQNRPCILLLVFLSFLLADLGKRLVGTVLVGVSTQKDVSMPAHALTQLGVCIQTLIALACAWQTSYVREAAEI